MLGENRLPAIPARLDIHSERRMRFPRPVRPDAPFCPSRPVRRSNRVIGFQDGLRFPFRSPSGLHSCVHKCAQNSGHERNQSSLDCSPPDCLIAPLRHSWAACSSLSVNKLSQISGLLSDSGSAIADNTVAKCSYSHPSFLESG